MRSFVNENWERNKEAGANNLGNTPAKCLRGPLFKKKLTFLNILLSTIYKISDNRFIISETNNNYIRKVVVF